MWIFVGYIKDFVEGVGVLKYYFVEEGWGCVDVVGWIVNVVFGFDLDELVNYCIVDVLVSFLFFWDIWCFDWV